MNKSLILKFFVVLIALSIPSLGKANATVWYVNSTGTGAGTSWADACPLLQDALDQASSGDLIWVAKGTYYPTKDNLGNPTTGRDAVFNILSTIGIYGGFIGTETQFGQRDYKANETILSGERGSPTNTDNCYHVAAITLDGGVIDGFTVSDGYGDSGGPGGIFCIGSFCKIENCVIKNNYGDDGAGIWAWNGAIEIYNCIIENNSAKNGGGIFHFNSNSRIFECVIRNNSASQDGGGVYNSGSVWSTLNVRFENCVIYNNTAGTNGGGMTNYESDNHNYITNCTFFGNSAGSGAHGIHNITNADFAYIANSILWDDTGTQINDPGANNEVHYSIVRGGWVGQGTSNSSSNPIFINPQDIDGQDNVLMTDDDGLIPHSSSPAVDAAYNNYANQLTSNLDIASQDRIYNGTVDMGAYEWHSCNQKSIEWTNFNFTQEVCGLLQNTNTIDDFCASAQSTNTLYSCEDGYVEMPVVTSTTIPRMFGLSNDRTSLCYPALQYGFYLAPGGTLFKLKGNAASIIGTYAIGDALKVEKIGNSIFFKKNETQISSSIVDMYESFFVKAHVFTQGATMEYIRSYSSTQVDNFNLGTNPIWSDFYNTQLTNDNLVSTRSTNNWCAGAESTQISSISTNYDFGFQYRIPNASTTAILGFSTTSGDCFGSTDYGFLIDQNNVLRYTVGYSHNYIGTFSVGDIIKMECEGNTLNWIYNCTVVHQETINRTENFRMDAQIWTAGGTVSEVNIWGLWDTPPTKSEAVIETIIEENDIVAYPNPTSGKLNILSNTDLQSIEVYSYTGKLITKLDNINGNETSIDLTNQTKGLYFAKILTSDNKLIVEKIVVQ